jgi:hypothetical protein
MPPSLPPLAVIAGPTASGKSALALRLARERGGVVINADASQCYADLNILSARPTPAEIAGAEHRLYGFRPADQPLGAADWASLARAEIAAAHSAGALPILVGGTGLYLRSLLGGIAKSTPRCAPASGHFPPLCSHRRSQRRTPSWRRGFGQATRSALPARSRWCAAPAGRSPSFTKCRRPAASKPK